MAAEEYEALNQAMVNAVARANVTWARVKNSMAGLLEWLLGYSADSIALHIYFAPNNTETRFKIVDVVAMVKWRDYKNHDLIYEWNAIFVPLGRVKETRNRIAHGEISVASKKRGSKWVYQARLTATSFDIARRQKEESPRQWPGMSVHDVMATADLQYSLALRIEEMRNYWRAYSIGPRESLPEIYVRIVERRQNTPPQ